MAPSGGAHVLSAGTAHGSGAMHRPEAAAAVLPKQVHCPETASRLGSGPC